MSEREYEKYEFCKAVRCIALVENQGCIMKRFPCLKRAKEFHQWLKANNFRIVKEETDG